MADQIALKLAGADGYVVTEAGFGADIGAEKVSGLMGGSGMLGLAESQQACPPARNLRVWQHHTLNCTDCSRYSTA